MRKFPEVCYKCEITNPDHRIIQEYIDLIEEKSNMLEDHIKNTRVLMGYGLLKKAYDNINSALHIVLKNTGTGCTVEGKLVDKLKDVLKSNTDKVERAMGDIYTYAYRRIPINTDINPSKYYESIGTFEEFLDAENTFFDNLKVLNRKYEPFIKEDKTPKILATIEDTRLLYNLSEIRELNENERIRIGQLLLKILPKKEDIEIRYISMSELYKKKIVEQISK